VPTVFGEAFTRALGQTDLLFCNAAEACAVTNTGSAGEAFERLRGLVPSAVVTDGPGGAYVRHAKTEAHAAAFPCEPRDLTGAGDMFAGAFLYGITHHVPPEKAARAANFLAMKVITQVGARLHHGTKSYWEQALAAA
jgi:sugar/nucleoside kinase (ribokinase family)